MSKPNQQKRWRRKVRYIIYRQTLIEPIDHLTTFIGAFLGIGLIGYLQNIRLESHDNLFLIGSFGASAVLVYGISNSPYSQPRNLIGGHLIGAVVGVSINLLLGHTGIEWLPAALAVSSSIVLMQMTKTLHPPGGATALIACIGSEKVKALGYWFCINPVLVGALILFTVALITHNIRTHRSYPR